MLPLLPLATAGLGVVSNIFGAKQAKSADKTARTQALAQTEQAKAMAEIEKEKTKKTTYMFMVGGAVIAVLALVFFLKR